MQPGDSPFKKAETLMELPGIKYKQMIDGNGGFEYIQYTGNNLEIDINAGILKPDQLTHFCDVEPVGSQQSAAVAALAGKVSANPSPAKPKGLETIQTLYGHGTSSDKVLARKQQFPLLPKSRPGSQPGSQPGSPKGGTRRKRNRSKNSMTKKIL